MAEKAYSVPKWLIKLGLVFGFLVFIHILEFIYPAIWIARTHITHPLHYAVQYNNLTFTKLLSPIAFFRDRELRDPSRMYCVSTPAEIAIDQKHYEALEIILNNKSSFNGCNDIPLLSFAIQKNDLKSFKMLVDHGADIKEKFFGSNFLDLAAAKCETNDTAIIEYLIANGLDVNARIKSSGTRSNEITTPLYSALMNKCVKNAKILLDHGANPNLALKGKSKNKSFRAQPSKDSTLNNTQYRNLQEVLDAARNYKLD